MSGRSRGQNIVPGSLKGQSCLGRAYLHLGLRDIRPGCVWDARSEERSCTPAVAKQASQNEHLLLLWTVLEQRDERAAWEEQAAWRTRGREDPGWCGLADVGATHVIFLIIGLKLCPTA